MKEDGEKVKERWRESGRKMERDSRSRCSAHGTHRDSTHRDSSRAHSLLLQPDVDDERLLVGEHESVEVIQCLPSSLRYPLLVGPGEKVRILDFLDCHEVEDFYGGRERD